MRRFPTTALLAASSILCANDISTSRQTPGVGSVLTWKYVRICYTTYKNGGWDGRFGSSSFRMSRDSGEVSWTVASASSDSLQWRRFEIRQSLHLTRTDTTDTSSTVVGIVYRTPTWNQILVAGTVTVQLRVDGNTGSAFASPNSLFPLEKGWWSGGSPLVATRPKVLFYRDGIDSVFFERSWDTAWSGTIVTRSTDTTTILRLVPERSTILENTGVLPRPKEEALTLGELSDRYPEVLVKWTLPSGRSGTLPASAFCSLPPDLRDRSLILQAGLPDGRSWQSTTLLR